MASELQVQTISGPPTGANANKILIPSGQTLDITDWDPPSGTVVNYQHSDYLPTGDINFNSTSWTEINSALRITYTPISTSNKLILRYRSTSCLWATSSYLHYTIYEVGGSNLFGARYIMRTYCSTNTEIPFDSSITIDAWSGSKTISPYAKVSTGNAYLNWAGGDNIMQFSIMEIAA